MWGPYTFTIPVDYRTTGLHHKTCFVGKPFVFHYFVCIYITRWEVPRFCHLFWSPVLCIVCIWITVKSSVRFYCIESEMWSPELWEDDTDKGIGALRTYLLGGYWCFVVGFDNKRHRPTPLQAFVEPSLWAGKLNALTAWETRWETKLGLFMSVTFHTEYRSANTVHIFRAKIRRRRMQACLLSTWHQMAIRLHQYQLHQYKN